MSYVQTLDSIVARELALATLRNKGRLTAQELGDAAWGSKVKSPVRRRLLGGRLGAFFVKRGDARILIVGGRRVYKPTWVHVSTSLGPRPGRLYVVLRWTDGGGLRAAPAPGGATWSRNRCFLFASHGIAEAFARERRRYDNPPTECFVARLSSKKCPIRLVGVEGRKPREDHYEYFVVREGFSRRK